MVTTNKGAKATPEAQPEAKAAKPNVHPSTLKASQNGTDIEDYARRLMASQSQSLALTFQMANIEQGLMKQDYEFPDIRKVIEKLYKELTGGK